MKFKIQEKLQQDYKYYVKDLDDCVIDAMAQVLTKKEYHELCHQLHGTKAEFDSVDGECEPDLDYITDEYRYRYTIKSAISRGIFWDTLKKLAEVDKEEWKKNNQDDLF